MANSYSLAKERFATLGVDTDAALATLATTPISVHCWQGDDVAGFENSSGNAGSGCLATGNHPGKARNFDELSADLEKVASIVPGKLRISLHATYATDNVAKADRDALEPGHFRAWLDWAKRHGWGMDFNPTCFGHPQAASGYTLSSADEGIRKFWIDHCIASRRIAAHFGKELDNPAVTNIWIPDGAKDRPADRLAPRQRLEASLDTILGASLGGTEKYNIDAVESKLFGIGVESYTVGSHEFYLGYAAKKNVALCLDAGHFHPTETLGDKISSVMMFVPRLLLHVSRGVRWDSDHVVALDDATRETLHEVVVGGFLPRTAIGLDFFDASINRIAAWVIGSRNTQKAILLGLLAPQARLTAAENEGNRAEVLALYEDFKSMPWGAVWDEFCARDNRPIDGAWFETVRQYEKEVLVKRV